MEALISQVLKARDKLGSKPPILVKIAPDLEDRDKADIASVVVTNSVCIDLTVHSGEYWQLLAHYKIQILFNF